LGVLVGNWSTFTKGWETAFGETADNFITFITTALSNGSLSVDQVKKILEQRKKILEQQKKNYIAWLYMTGGGVRDEKGNIVADAIINAYNQAIAGTNAMVGSIDQTGKLPGDTGDTANNKAAMFQAYQSKSQAATALAKSKANKDSVARAILDAKQAEDEYQQAIAFGQDQQTLDDLDAKRRDARQAVVDAAKGVADAVRGIAKAQAAANKDSVAQAILDLDQANADYKAAVASGDKEGIANAIAAQIAARAAIRDALIARKEAMIELAKAKTEDPEKQARI
jgi:hypothetical protein